MADCRHREAYLSGAFRSVLFHTSSPATLARGSHPAQALFIGKAQMGLLHLLLRDFLNCLESCWLNDNLFHIVMHLFWTIVALGC